VPVRRLVALGVLLTLSGGALAGALVIWSGVVDIAATKAGGLLDVVLGYAAVQAIRRHSSDAQNPLGHDAAALKAGLEHYRTQCLACHGGPGAMPAPFAAGLHPAAPDLTSPEIQSFTDGMLYTTISGGIGSTGMPAFGPVHSPAEIWSIVAFLRHLKALSPEEKQQLGKQLDCPAPAAGPPAAPNAGTASASAAAGGADAHVHRIAIANLKFDPPSLEVQAGDVVVWTNTDFVAHTATADDGTFDTGTMEADGSKRVVLAKKGTFPYACRFHPTMKGTLMVR
jgi:plastocyanin/mono/diheme cytochrome c family protein